jgi:2-dehydro-3-deoxygluconokinase
LIGYADLVVAGEDEADLLGDLGPGLVVIKRGARGAVGIDGGTRVEVPAFRVPEVDTVGAGDAFAAGLLSALLRDRPLDRALREASAVAALCVAAPGDTDGLPTAAERDAYLAGGADVAR